LVYVSVYVVIGLGYLLPFRIIEIVDVIGCGMIGTHYYAAIDLKVCIY